MKLVTCRQDLVVMSFAQCNRNDVADAAVRIHVTSPILKADALVKASLLEQGYLMCTKKVHGCATGDLMRADVSQGKKAGVHLGRIAVRATGSLLHPYPTLDEWNCSLPPLKRKVIPLLNFYVAEGDVLFSVAERRSITDSVVRSDTSLNF